MSKVSKQLRTEAALCADVLACTPDAWNWECAGFDTLSFNLAWDAFVAVRRHYLGDMYWSYPLEDQWGYMAEAAAILRDGWTP